MILRAAYGSRVSRTSAERRKSETDRAEQLSARESIANRLRCIEFAEYPNRVETHEATLTYLRPLPNGTGGLWLDLFPAIPMSRGTVHDSFVAHFELRETREIAGLRTLRGLAPVEKFVAFFGATWCEALGRWTDLSWMHEYRREHGAETYTAIDAWQEFYALLDDGVLPIKIELAFIEHY